MIFMIDDLHWVYPDKDKENIMSDVGILCPIFNSTCLKESCIAYKAFTKEAFRDILLDKYIPIDDLSFYRTLSSEELEARFDRIVSITRECKFLGTIIEKEDIVDHNVPNPTKDYYQ